MKSTEQQDHEEQETDLSEVVGECLEIASTGIAITRSMAMSLSNLDNDVVDAQCLVIDKTFQEIQSKLNQIQA